MLKKICLLGYWAILLPAASSGEPSDFVIRPLAKEYVVRSWSKEQGLPDRHVNSILKARDGCVWVATPSGLARFDGTKFLAFNRANTPQMPSDNCIALAEEAQGTLWVATALGLLQRTEQDFRLRYPWPTKGSSPEIALSTNGAGGLWIGTSHGLCHLSATQTNWYSESDGLLSEQVTALCDDGAGMVWVGTRRGLQSLTRSNGHFQPRQPTGSRPGCRVDDIAMTPDGSVWVSIEDGKYSSLGSIYRFHHGQWTRRNAEALANFNEKHMLSPGVPGTLWTTSNDERPALCRIRGSQITQLNFADTLPKSVATAVCAEDNGSLWLGTSGEGLHLLTPRCVTTYNTADGLVDDEVRAILESSAGSVWIGTERGLSRFRAGEFQNYTKQTGLAGDRVRALAEDGHGRVWIGTGGDGLSCLDRGGFHTLRLPGGPSANKVTALCATRDQSLWIGTVRGLHRFRLSHATPAAPLASGPAEWASLGELTTLSELAQPSPWIHALMEDSSGTIWAGTRGNGLYRIRDDHGTLRIEHRGERNGLSSDNVWALLEDRGGVVWFATERGLNRYDAGTIKVFAERDGLPDSPVNSILQDAAGNLWIGHDHGVARVDPKKLAERGEGDRAPVPCVRFDEWDGLLKAETNGRYSQPSAAVTRDGRLWFATPAGVAVFDPANLPDASNAPAVRIEQVRANARIVFEDGGLAGRSSDVASGNARKRLPAGSGRVMEFDFAAAEFVAPERLQFRYRLDGLDETWIDAGPSRRAYYANLKPGNYSFHVVAANRHGVWNPTGAAFRFHLAPFYYQTRWFLVVATVAVGILSVFILRWRSSYLERIHRLEQAAALTQDRARIAKDLHDGLGAQLTHLTILAEWSDRRQEDPSGLKERLRQLSRLARETAAQLREVIWINHPGDETLEGLAARICHQAEQFFRPAEIRCRFDIPDRLPPMPLSAQARHHLVLAAREAMNNVVKHAAAHEVRIEMECHNDSLRIVIRDDGRHWPSPGPGAASPVARSGHGLRNMQDRVESLGGRFAIDGRPGNGTAVSFEVPLSNMARS